RGGARRGRIERGRALGGAVLKDQPVIDARRPALTEGALKIVARVIDSTQAERRVLAGHEIQPRPYCVAVGDDDRAIRGIAARLLLVLDAGGNLTRPNAVAWAATTARALWPEVDGHHSPAEQAD